MGRGRFNLKRRKHVRQPKRIFYIFCEGQNTEPGYFKSLRSKYRNALIQIETYGPIGVPKTIATTAISHLKKIGKENGKSNSSFARDDQVWVVFDRDEHGCYYEAINLCEQGGVSVARSNPCFELWLILHDVSYDKPVGRDAVAKFLGTIRTDYDAKKKTLDFNEIISRIEDAEKRAAKQLKARKAEGGKPLGHPYTTVGNLTRAIREAAEGGG